MYATSETWDFLISKENAFTSLGLEGTNGDLNELQYHKQNNRFV